MFPLQCSNHHPLLAYSAVIAAVMLIFPSQAQILKPETYEFGPFNQSYYDILSVLPNAAINLGALQVTPDSSGNVDLTNRSGRVFFNKPFTLWEDDAGKLASFNTSFLVNVYRPKNNDTPGEGIAFLLAPSSDTVPLNSHGQFLGLTNASNDGNATNQILAVELDTVKQDFDPDDNHLGLDVNGVRSKVTVPLTPLGFQIAPNGTRFHAVWVQYDGDRKLIRVYIAEQSDKDAPLVPKPAQPVLNSSLDLRQVLNRVSYLGFSASTGANVELNCVLRWNISIEVFPDDGGAGSALKIGLGVGIPVVVLALACFVGWFLWLRKRNRESESNILGTLKSLPGTPREFSFQELRKATNNFDHKLKLGQGGYGVVYRATLPKENAQVAVKMFSRDEMKSADDFLAELTIINRLRHKNLVRLLGWCHKNGVLLLVYDYMPNGSLDKHIFCEEDSSTRPLSWPLRYKIITGVASALNYLHNEYDQKVVHRDLKASNIMLDSDFNARLGDFGLARALENDKTSYAEFEGVHGTMGYIAPECFHTGRATRESDVYGFGAVLLEVVCGQRPWTKNEGYECLVDWVWHLHREQRILDAVDPRLGNECVVEEAERVLRLGLACSHPVAAERPKMQSIVQIISGSVDVPHVPPFKPAFMWPALDLSSLASDLTASTTPTTSNTHSLQVQFSDTSSLV
ncbi:hypothetical protein Fmac_002733 [Flemingia macrophylla]|uniref:non-specific serine/threonine protein kinase n=1 Tax=Flemingia macrophylla TaxID=520843 RepID=A0ABD1NKS4_9FABA